MLIYMPTVEILNSHSVSVLRKEIAKSNDKLGIIKSYSKGMKKAEIIDLMMKHKDRFHHIKIAEKKVRAPPLKSETAKKKSQPAQQPAQQAKKIEPKKRVAKTATVIAPKKELTKERKERKENYNDESDNLKLYEEGKKIMTLKTYDRLVKRIDDTKMYSNDWDDLTKRLEKLKPTEPAKKEEKKEAPKKKIKFNIKKKEEDKKQKEPKKEKKQRAKPRPTTPLL